MHQFGWYRRSLFRLLSLFRGKSLFVLQIFIGGDFMIKPEYAQVLELAKDYDVIPIFKECYADVKKKHGFE